LKDLSVSSSDGPTIIISTACEELISPLQGTLTVIRQKRWVFFQD